MKARIPLIASILFLQAAALLPADPNPNPGTAGSKPIALSGLTDGLSGALASRPAITVRIGTDEASLESFFAKDFAAAFRCDAVANEYLDRAEGQATYEMLAYAIKNRLEESLGPYALVEASALGDDGSLMRFGIALSQAKDVAVPVSIRSGEGRLSTSFSLPCVAELEFEAELFVDSRLVNQGQVLRGSALRIKDFSIRLRYAYDARIAMEESKYKEPPNAVPLSYGKKKYMLAASDLALEASVNYRLYNPAGESPEAVKYSGPSDEEGGEEEAEPADILSFEDFSTGNYAWESDASAFIAFSFEETGKRPKSESERDACGLSYSFDDHSEYPDRERLVFYDGAESFELEGPAARALKKGK